MSSVDVILNQAKEREEAYDWLGAAESLGKAIGFVPETDFLKLGQVQEKVGYAFHRAAMQAESVDEFRDRIQQAIADYERAKEFYGRLGELGKKPWMLRCDAMIAYMGHWLASEASEKKRLLDGCWKLTKEALKSFEEAGDALEYGKTYNQLSSSACDKYVLEWSFQTREMMVKEALERGERAITLLSGADGSHELAKAYVKTAMYLTIISWYFISDMDEKDSHSKKGLNYWQKANELSEETAFLELLSMCGEALDWTIDEKLAHYGKALDYAKKTKDKYLIGSALDWLAFASFWKSLEIGDPDKRIEFTQKALQYAKDTVHHFSSISYTSPRGGAVWTAAPSAEYYVRLASWETNLRKKRDFLEKAVVEGTDAIIQAENTGYPDIIMYVHGILVRMLVSLAQLEKKSEEKKRLLGKALEHSTELMKISEQLERFAYWNLGARWCFLAYVKAELSDIEGDTDKKKNMFEEAVSLMERGLRLLTKYSLHAERKGDLAILGVQGNTRYRYGKLLNRLFVLTSNDEHQRRAIKAFEEAAQSYQKPSIFSRVAECRWKVAASYEDLGEHLEAAENFNMASDDYKSAAERIPQLKDLYQDHALYMQAWSEIERAKHHHQRQEYSSAEEHFQKAADLHKALKQWSYLMPNYLAWAKVEQAEDLSRKEQSEEALQIFEHAATLFSKAKKSLERKLEEIDNPDEKTLATDLTKASGSRREYCLGRMAIEVAKILDKKGDHFSSSQKYGAAAQTFEKIIQTLESEHERKEIRLVAILSQAWQKMTRAEAEESPDLYMEASRLFEEAKDLSPSEQAKTLTLGHSRFCKALEVGTRFVDTRDPELHTVAVQHLESAATHYVKGGFRNASEYAKASERLFDAYMHVDNAKRESDPEKKAKFYAMAEKILQSSARSFVEAGHPEKREQVLRLLEKVKEERELATSLCEVLHTPPIVSATTAFGTPAPTHESAVGLERFEKADIQANVVTLPTLRELKMGENLHLRVELVNAGKRTALLTRISDVVPESFDLVEEPETYSVEDRDLNMKGKQLKPLKTEEINIVLRPLNKGTFMVRPRIMYLDEDGYQMSSEPEPKRIDVSEFLLPSRVSTGFADLDNLLLGGLPENRVILMASPACDERDMLIRSFLETGAKKGETAFYLTIDVSGIRDLAQEYQSNFYVFVCNPQTDETMENLPHAFKLRGVENLTEIDIALTSAFRRLDPSIAKRACIVIISDVLLLHGASSARRWLAALIPQLRSNCFTTLAVMNPKMHPLEVTQAILDLFDGEIDIFEKETKRRTEKMLKIKRLGDQNHLDTELPLRKKRQMG